MSSTRIVVYQSNVLGLGVRSSRRDVVDGPVDQWRALDGVGPRVYVRRGAMIGFDTLTYSAWVECEGWGTHSTGTYLDSEEAPGLVAPSAAPVHLGLVGTARLPAELEALPAYSDERVNAVRAFHRSGKLLAHLLIREAFPEFAGFGPVRDTDDSTFYRDLHGVTAQRKREWYRKEHLERSWARQRVGA